MSVMSLPGLPMATSAPIRTTGASVTPIIPARAGPSVHPRCGAALILVDLSAPLLGF